MTEEVKEERTKNEYVIGGKTFKLKKLNLGKWRKLLSLLKDVDFKGEQTLIQTVSGLSEKIPYIFQVILIGEEETTVEFFDNNVYYEDVVLIFSDFLALHPVFSVMERLGMEKFPKVTEGSIM